MCSHLVPQNTKKAISQAVSHYWTTRSSQENKQTLVGHSDQGARAAVTGGAQMNGFIQLFTNVLIDTGIHPNNIFINKSLELPGYFRPTKEWDLLVIKDHQLVVAIEAKSQVGPSFGNNFNNRTEEAMGSALDLWTAYREGAFNTGTQPFLGYFFMLEDCTASQSPVKVKEPHFQVFPEFINSSYSKRYELFCRKLVRERHYSGAAFITSKKETGLKGIFLEPAEDLTMSVFLRALVAHASAYV